MADDAGRRGFLSRAPELRAALVSELAPLVEKIASLSEDERAVLRHSLAHAGFGEDGRLRLPSYAALWGQGGSWLPAVALPEESVRAAVRTLKRRGVLRTVAAGGGVDVVVVLEHETLKGLA